MPQAPVRSGWPRRLTRQKPLLGARVPIAAPTVQAQWATARDGSFLNGSSTLGIPVTEAVGYVCPGIGADRPSGDLCNRVVKRHAAARTWRPGYPPSVLLKLLIYGYLNREFDVDAPDQSWGEP